MRRYWKVILPTVGLMALVFVYVWPTPYRAIVIQPGGRYLAAREHRFSHQVQLLTPTGWTTAAPSPTPDSVKDPLASYKANWRR